MQEYSGVKGFLEKKRNVRYIFYWITQICILMNRVYSSRRRFSHISSTTLHQTLFIIVALPENITDSNCSEKERWHFQSKCVTWCESQCHLPHLSPSYNAAHKRKPVQTAHDIHLFIQWNQLCYQIMKKKLEQPFVLT